MFYFLLTLLVLDAILLTVVVLLQAGKGGGLAAMGGGGAGVDTMFGGKQAATLLTKATWWSGGIFLALALALSILSGRARQPDSILRGELQGVATPPAAIPGVVEPTQAEEEPATPATSDEAADAATPEEP